MVLARRESAASVQSSNGFPAKFVPICAACRNALGARVVSKALGAFVYLEVILVYVLYQKALKRICLFRWLTACLGWSLLVQLQA